MSTAWPDGRWHYRRSLASRVAVLTTVALGLSIAVMAFTAFVVMRQQMMSSLDQSLLNRAHKATAYTTLSRDHRRGRSRLDARRRRRADHLRHRRGHAP